MFAFFCLPYISLDVRRSVYRVNDQVKFNSACSATAASKNIKKWNVVIIASVDSRE